MFNTSIIYVEGNKCDSSDIHKILRKQTRSFIT